MEVALQRQGEGKDAGTIDKSLGGKRDIFNSLLYTKMRFLKDYIFNLFK